MKLLMLLAAMAAPRPCLTEVEAQAVALVALPEVIRQTGVLCASSLPAGALLSRPQSPMLVRYAAEAERAWPAARDALVKLSGPEANALLGSQFARPLLTTLVAPLIVARAKRGDCAKFNRLVTALEPLPPRNTASVLVTALGWMQERKPRAGDEQIPMLPLCPVAK